MVLVPGAHMVLVSGPCMVLVPGPCTVLVPGPDRVLIPGPDRVLIPGPDLILVPGDGMVTPGFLEPPSVLDSLLKRDNVLAVTTTFNNLIFGVYSGSACFFSVFFF